MAVRELSAAGDPRMCPSFSFSPAIPLHRRRRRSTGALFACALCLACLTLSAAHSIHLTSRRAGRVLQERALSEIQLMGRVGELERELQQASHGVVTRPFGSSLAQDQRLAPGLLPAVLQGGTGPQGTGRPQETGGAQEPQHGGGTPQGAQESVQNSGAERGGGWGQGGGEGAQVLAPLKVEALTETLDFSAMVRLALNPLDRWNTMGNRVRFTCGAPDTNDATNGTATAASYLPACPSFQSCDARFLSASPGSPSPETLPSPLAPPDSIAACSSGVEDAPGYTWLKPPLNCLSWYTMDPQKKQAILDALPPNAQPPLWYLPKDREPWLEFQAMVKDPALGCGHWNDFAPEIPAAYSVYRLKGVYVCKEAHVFNKRSLFLRQGCQESKHHEMPYTMEQGAFQVRHVGAVVNWAYRQGGNFYHSFIESFPLFLTLGPILHANPGIPILGLPQQFQLYRTLLQPLVGVPLGNMPRYEFDTRTKDLFHADTLYQPVFPACGQLSRVLWTEMRRRHLLHPQGIPMFNPDWSPRQVTPLTDDEMGRIPEDWVVVVAQRPGPKRAIVGIKEIEEQVIAMFPPHRVAVFTGSMPILEARALFNRARLYVAGHGAALSNMVFMPKGSSVVEIRPDHYLNPCFHSLAEASLIDYYLLFGSGSGTSKVYVNVSDVMQVVRGIAAKF